MEIVKLLHREGTGELLGYVNFNYIGYRFKLEIYLSRKSQNLIYHVVNRYNDEYVRSTEDYKDIQNLYSEFKDMSEIDLLRGLFR